MTGGELVFDDDIQCPRGDSNCTATVDLHGGTITADDMQFKPGGLFDFEGDGTLILDGDKRVDVETWINAGYMTAYGGDGELEYDYGVTNAGKTTIYALAHRYKASQPSPAHLAKNVCPDVNLAWAPGDFVDTHTIYFGTSPNDVNLSIADPCVTGYDSNVWDPDLELGKTYYWRIIEVNDGNNWVASPWQFEVETGKARDPFPGDDMKGLPVDANLSWTPSCLADSNNLYFGTSWADVNNGTGGTSKGAQSSPYDPGPLDPFTWYYWRVDEVGSPVGGNVWSFRTRKGLLLYYKFDGSQGGNLPNPITDDSGNNIQFTQHIDGGSLTYGAPNPMYNLSGTSADFDPCAGLYRPDAGDDDFLRLDTYQYTIEMWVKVQVAPEGGDAVLIGKGPWRFILNDVRWGDDPWDNEVRWFHNNDATGEEGAVEEDEWMHVAAVYDQTLADDGESQRLYIDGDEVSDGGHADLNPADNNAISIGLEARADGNFAMYLDGQIDELRVLDMALAPLEFLYPQAIDPSPFDGEGGIDPNDSNEPDDPNVTLSWTPWAYADYHDLYFGSDYDSVRLATVGDDPNNVYVDRLDSNSYDINGLDYSAVYYWRVDEVEGSDPYPGEVWEFTTEFQIIDPNLLLWYPYDEMEGDWVLDHSGHGLHGTNDDVGDGWDPDGRFDGSLIFNDDMGFDLPTRTLDGVSKEITIAVWLDGYREGGENWVVSAGVTPYDFYDHYLDVIVPDGDDDFVYWRAGNDTNDLLIWNDATPRDWVGDWHHFAFVKDENAGTMSIYFDADLVKSKAGTISSLVNLVDTPFSVAARIGLSADYVGRMDDLRVYDYALSKAEIGGLFRGGDVELAWGPSPYDGQPDAPYDSNLMWRPGDYADLHDVYFGTNWDEVNDANATIHPNVDYAQLDVNTHGLDVLDLGEWYYWRVDEINDSNNDFWRGNVWRFRAAEYIIIDDMEPYTQTKDYPIGYLSGATAWGWDSAYQNGTGAFLYPSCATCQYAKIYHGGDQSMYYMYDLTDDYGCGYYYAEISNHFDMEPNDWTTAGVKMLTLWFRGDPCNANPAGGQAVEQMYVGLQDDDSTYAEVRYGDGDNEDINDVAIAEWQEWNIPLNEFTTVDLERVDKLCIGFGERYSLETGGWGYVYFDDIRLYQPTCVASKLQPDDDLNDDCIVDFGDVRVMAGEWLMSDANLGEVTNPSDANLVGWWKFDEGSGGIAYDSSGYDNNGVIETIETNVEWVPGRNDVNYALDFDGGWVGVADDGNTPELRPERKLSVAAWINIAQHQDDDVRIVARGRDNHETYALEINDEDRGLSFIIRDANGAALRDLDSKNELPTNSWTHVAGTYDGNEMTSYVNGQVELTAVKPGWEKLEADANDGFAIGGRWGDAGEDRFRGMMDDVRVYDTNLTAEEIGYLASDGTGIVAMESIANLVNPEPLGERAVNFRDFAVLADSWLQQELWPE
jgi:hypothetical protein